MSYISRYWAPLLGVASVLVGLFLAWTAPWGAGWTATAPLTSLSFAPVVVPSQFIWGVALAVTGLVLLAGWAGFQIGVARTRPSE